MLKQITTLALASLVFTGAGCAGDSQDAVNSQPGSANDRVPLNDTVTGAYRIRLTSPQEGQILKSPFLVGGEASVPGDTVYIRVKNPAGEVVISEQTRAKPEQGSQGPAPFSVLLSFVFRATDRGTVEVYGIDPAANAEAALESVGVTFDTSSDGSTPTPSQ